MKQVFTIAIICVVFTNSIYAQKKEAATTYKKIQVNFSFGGGIPPGKNQDGIESYADIISIEPRYNITDNLGIGIKYAYSEDFSNFKDEVARRKNNSFIADFTFTDDVFRGTRYFLGAGIGFTSYTNKIDTAFIFIPTGKGNTYTGTGFAFMPRIGFEVSKFTADISYNYTGNKGANFFGFSLGFFLGGGKHKH